VLLFLRYFWFVCAIAMAVNVAILRSRLATLVSRGAVSQAEADRFTRWAALWLIGGPTVLGVIGLAARWPMPFCAGVLEFDSLPRALSSLVILAAWIALLWWVWGEAGADLLSRIGPALGRSPSYDKAYSPRRVRLAVTALVLISAVGAVVASRSIPASPDITCPAPTVAD